MAWGKTRRDLWTTLLLGAALGCGGIESSDREYSYRVVQVPTQALSGLDSVTVALHEFGVDDGAEPLVLVFLHGVGGSHASWENLGGSQAVATIRARASGPRWIIVAPEGDSLGWPDLRDGTSSWTRFLVDDLPRFLRAEYDAVLAPPMLGVSGVSAGGVTALTLGLRFPNVFGCVSAHSPAIHPSNPQDMADWARGWDGWAAEYGAPIDTVLWRARNPIALVEALPTSLPALSIYFDAGAEDHLGFQRTSGLLSKQPWQRGASHMNSQFAQAATGMRTTDQCSTIR